MPDPSPRIKVREGAAAWREVEGETIVLQLESSLYLGINAAGTVLWPAMVEGATADDLTDRLASAFSIDRSRAAADVETFLALCREHNLLEA
jgi:hypothetical protein